jgi:hypothetical protein
LLEKAGPRPEIVKSAGFLKVKYQIVRSTVYGAFEIVQLIEIRLSLENSLNPLSVFVEDQTPSSSSQPHPPQATSMPLGHPTAMSCPCYYFCLVYCLFAGGFAVVIYPLTKY